MSTDVIRLTDLGAPEFSPEITALRTNMAAMGENLDFAPAALRALAAAEVGLDDFGDTQYEAPLEVLSGAILSSQLLSPIGRLMMHAQLTQLLKNRLLLTDLLRRHPEIHELEVARPIVICGLPRTGTTHLHNLMAADTGLRSLPYWEALEPFPLPAEVGAEPDPRLARCELGLGILDQSMPYFKRMHEMTTWHVHEEIQLLAIDFSTMFFESISLLPEWRDYYMSHDQTPHYQYMKTVLKALQFLRGGDRWVLKSPQHLEQFGPLHSTFPDATFVVTHRDPVEVVTSMATMATYSARMYHDPVDPALFGGYWADRLEVMLKVSLRDRKLLPESQSIDVRFDDYMADEIAMIQRIYELADQPFTPDVESMMSNYMAEHPRGRHGLIDYHPEDIGLQRTDLEKRLSFYSERFLAE